MSLEPKFSQDAGLIMAGKISALLQTKPPVGQNCGQRPPYQANPWTHTSPPQRRYYEMATIRRQCSLVMKWGPSKCSTWRREFESCPEGVSYPDPVLNIVVYCIIFWSAVTSYAVFLTWAWKPAVIFWGGPVCACCSSELMSPDLKFSEVLT